MTDHILERSISDDGIPVIDAHHHLFDRIPDALADHVGCRKFLIDEYLAYLGDKHDVVASVALEARAMYRADGPEHLRAAGETEFLNGQAAMAASGLYGKTRVAAGIVGYADLTKGDQARELLEAHLAAAPQRFKGVRQEALWDEDSSALGGLFDIAPQLYASDRFREGFRHLAPLGLSFDAFVIEPQLADVVDLARSFPDTQIILNHLGNPVGSGVYGGNMSRRLPEWEASMRELALCENVVVKVGGLGSFLSGSPLYRSDPPATLGQLIWEWQPFALGALELFGANRCMFESNVPTDGSGSFDTVCTAYKRIFAGCSVDERRDIFARTAARIYRLDVPEVTAA